MKPRGLFSDNVTISIPSTLTAKFEELRVEVTWRNERKGGRKDAFSNGALEMGSCCELLSNVTAFGETDAV